MRDRGTSAKRWRSIISHAAVALALAYGCIALSRFLSIVLGRIAYPYDLEWMEGGMLCHALRLSAGLPIYVPPSVDFIPHLYTPLYPVFVTALGKLAGGPGYLPARLVSLLSFLLALGIAAAWIRRESGSIAAAFMGISIPIVSFPLTGGFYDLARSDSLMLLLTTAGAALSWHGRRSHVHVAAAAALLVAAFFAKQTAAPIIVAIGLGLLLTWRAPVITFAITGTALFALITLLLDHFSSGWFFTYIFRLHQSHAFFTRRAYIETPRLLFAALGPALLLVPLALWLMRRERPHGLAFLTWLGLAGLFTACLGFGTQWAHVNAFIPGMFFPAIAMGASAGRLLHARALQSAPRLVATRLVVGLLFIATLHPLLARLRPADHLPTAEDRAAGDALIERLRAEEGEVLIPFHPFYAHLAGKRTFLHRMGIWDVRGTVAGPVRGLAEALAARRFSLIVFDDKVEGTWHDWPGVLGSYRVVEHFRGPRVVEGARTVPGLVLRPIPERETQGIPIDQELH